MVFDDWIDMNIQSGSQWDGFRHYGHQTQGRFYNNLTPEEVKSGKSVTSFRVPSLTCDQARDVVFKRYLITALLVVVCCWITTRGR